MGRLILVGAPAFCEMAKGLYPRRPQPTAAKKSTNTCYE
jgi:hypothetical protein